jgi:hypothetical protein
MQAQRSVGATPALFADANPLTWLVDEWLRVQLAASVKPTAANLSAFLRTTNFIFGCPTTDEALRLRSVCLKFPADASGAKRRRAWFAGRQSQLDSLAAGPTALLADDTLCTFYVRMGTQMVSAEGTNVIALQEEVARLKRDLHSVKTANGMNKAIKVQCREELDRQQVGMRTFSMLMKMALRSFSSQCVSDEAASEALVDALVVLEGLPWDKEEASFVMPDMKRIVSPTAIRANNAVRGLSDFRAHALLFSVEASVVCAYLDNSGRAFYEVQVLTTTYTRYVESEDDFLIIETRMTRTRTRTRPCRTFPMTFVPLSRRHSPRQGLAECVNCLPNSANLTQLQLVCIKFECNGNLHL